MSTSMHAILADVIRPEDCGDAADRIAANVLEALTDERIVANAAQALESEGWTGVTLFTEGHLVNIALAVLRSVRGG